MTAGAPLPELGWPWRRAVLAAADPASLDDPTRERDDAWLLYHYAGMAARARRDEVALLFLRAAVRRAPENVRYLTQLGATLRRAGCDRESVSVLWRALRRCRQDASLRLQLGRALHGAGRLRSAEVMLRAATRLDPSRGDIWIELGEVLQRRGRSEAADEAFGQAMQVGACDVDVHVRLGQICMARERWTDAAAAYARAIGLGVQPERSDLHLGLGQALLRLGRLPEAMTHFQDALAIDPTNVRACRGVVLLIERLGRADEAGDAWRALGSALSRREQYEQAVPAFLESLTRQPHGLSALIELGGVYVRLARLDEARRCFQSALALDAGHPRAELGLSQVMQLSDDAEGERLEANLYLQRSEKRRFGQPRWQGECVRGRTVLVWADEALGDTIRFARYVALFTQSGARVVIECHRLLMPFLRTLPGVDRVVPKGTALPAFDLHVPFSSLPYLFAARGEVAADTSSSPYLAADPQLIQWWQERLTKADCRRPHRQRFTVGLVWSGDPKGMDAALRFTSLSTFAPLGDLAGVRFISLQFGLAQLELLAPPPGLDIEVFPEASRSIADEAALMSHLDLIITVDTMSAHLAGALGRPVWTLLASAACRRWRNDHHTCRAYPTMHLFRQTEAGNWIEVIARVRTALQDRVDLMPTGGSGPQDTLRHVGAFMKP
jgi:Flp pilus assembly protein TadD